MSTREEIIAIKQDFEKLVRMNAKADDIWKWMDGRGFVIRVDRELPIHTGSDYDTRLVWRIAQGAMIGAGYVAVKPLIEE